MHSINIIVDNGSGIGNYTQFDVKRQSGEDVCKIYISDPLNDCTDQSAAFGVNEYLVSAQSSGGSSLSESFLAYTLKEDRMLLISPFTLSIFTKSMVMLACMCRLFWKGCQKVTNHEPNKALKVDFNWLHSWGVLIFFSFLCSSWGARKCM